ncbi:hypothetical protein [Streptomyces marianii]|uniref:Uncharacterized protein n=1 Tax=Streptomyces marianii TaxID=1817406 RepID=A0A5R9E147_9ACTN|nr:hypothetical protein [Streptomyces marianii]TLQ43648.1 hypothetical protein FEF34_11275 [Streptomyces marianii]
MLIRRVPAGAAALLFPATAGHDARGDFFNAWNQAEPERRVRDCAVAGYICGTDGRPLEH